jgi:galactokinase
MGTNEHGDSTLIANIIKSFHEKFHTRNAPRLFQAPGRINLIGEHTDYNQGFVLPAAIDRHIVLAARAREDSRINVYAVDFKQWERFDLGREISPSPEKSWGDYIRGMAWVLLQNNPELKGMDAVIAGDIPIGAGLSSSAALEVVVGYALLQLSGIERQGPLLAKAAQRAENEFVGMRCGIMDQFIACLGKTGHALLIDCRDLSHQAVPLPSQVAWVIVDSGVHRGLVDMEYNTRRQECETAARHFDVAALRDLDMVTFQSRAHELSEVVRRRARHVISENERTLSAAKALKRGDLAAFGRLMTASHMSLRDDFEVSCSQLDWLVETAVDVPGVYGARLTGAGFGGCMLAAVDQRAVETFVNVLATRYPAVAGKPATAYICKASQGVAEIKNH